MDRFRRILNLIGLELRPLPRWDDLRKTVCKQSKLTYDKEEGTIMIEKNDESVTFKMPHKMEMFEDIEDLNTDNILPFFIASKGDEEKGESYVNTKRMTHYPECLKLGPEYERDKGIIKTIRFLNGKVFGKHWKGIHVTWAQLEKKRDKDTTLQDFDGALNLQCMETASRFSLTSSKLEGYNVTIFSDVVTVADLKKPIEDSAEIKRRDVECRERDVRNQEYRQRQDDTRFYLQPYDHLTGDARLAMEELRAEIKAKYDLPD
ncbi:hypothetical protein Tco_0272340 [Tanacetum coccineum]